MTVKTACTQKELEMIIELRYEILRLPWLQPESSARDNLEDSSVNAYIGDGTAVLACGRLQKNPDGRGQIRYMAVRTEMQGKGLGAKVLAYLENEATRLGIKEIELQARENALAFYLAQGYSIVEKSFVLWGQIQHYLMRKELDRDLPADLRAQSRKL